MKLRVFCDFDGTVAVNDVGNLVFTTFGDAGHWWDLVQAWKANKIDSREMWRRQAAIMRISLDALDRFTATQPLDPHFAKFYAFCLRHNIPVVILSDGMDLYIRRILAHHGLNAIEVYSNQLLISSDQRVSVHFPYFQEGCGVCANCKGYHIRRMRQPTETTVYVGDGYSDLCALHQADLLFAKKDLQHHCEEHGIPFTPFQTFREVEKNLLHLLSV